MEGGHRSQNRLADALLLALLETGVPVSAFDAAAVDGPVGLREALAGERLGRGELAPQLSPGMLVLADAERPLGELFGDLADDALPTPPHRAPDARQRAHPAGSADPRRGGALDLLRGARPVGPVTGAGPRRCCGRPRRGVDCPQEAEPRAAA